MAQKTIETARLPPRWFIELAWKIHRALYRGSGGRFGLRQPKPGPGGYGLAQLTTTGRRSGEPRSVMIGYFEDGDDIITMAMNGWGAAEPAWWLNLLSDPSATLVLPDGPTKMVGRAATGAERERLWALWSAIDTKLELFAARRPTETAVVVLSPVEQDAD